MIKMYNAEVLRKFPVVQHFYFGSLFSWTEDPGKGDEGLSTPQAYGADVPSSIINPQVATRAPWAKPLGSAPPSQVGMDAMTRVPWVRAPATQPPPGQMAPTDGGPMTKAPWAT